MVRLALVLAALAASSACQHQEPAPALQEPRPAVIVGGYAPADADAPDLKAARSLATDALYKKFPQRALVEAVTAERQVVAGFNFRFTFTMSGGKKYVAVVYQDLQQKLSVTQVEAVS